MPDTCMHLVKNVTAEITVEPKLKSSFFIDLQHIQEYRIATSFGSVHPQLVTSHCFLTVSLLLLYGLSTKNAHKSQRYVYISQECYFRNNQK